MWSYEKNNKGFQINYTNKKGGGFTFQLPPKQETNDTIMYWDEKSVSKLVKGLNTGGIQFNIGEYNPNKKGIEFDITIPKEYKARIDKWWL